jgi:hypothetical protein
MALKMGSKSDQVKSIQIWLKEMGFGPGKIDGIYGEKTEKSVIRFQESVDLYADGIVGPITMDALEEAYMTHSIELTSPGLGSVEGDVEGRLQFVRCEADQYGEGYGHFWLRSDAAEQYNKVKEAVKNLGGLLTSSGAKRSLRASVGANRSAVSFHYLGLALDLHLWSGMEDPENDPYVICLKDLDDRRFEVFVRCKKDKVETVRLTNIVRYTDPESKDTPHVEGPFKSLTALFEAHGFHPIRARRRFFEDGRALAAEWWHFQYERALVPKISTFGGELLKVYSREQVMETPPWRYRNHIFKINWF